MRFRTPSSFLAVTCATICALGIATAPAPASADSGEVSIGPIQALAHVPYPGNPGGLAIDGNTLWVDTSSGNLDRPFDGSSSVFAYDLATGQLQAGGPNPIIVPKPPVAVMGLAGIALDSSGRLYVGDMNGRVVRIDPTSGSSSTYATVPTSTQTSLTDMPTFDSFGPDGSLYVGDAAQPVIWRVPRGGGQAEAWFVDPRLGGAYGSTVDGVTVDPSGRYLYFAANNQPLITVYRLPLAKPDALHLETVHHYTDETISPCSVDPSSAGNPNPTFAAIACAAGPAFGAGGMAFGASGRLYVALLTKNQLSILSPNGSELARFPDPQQNMQLNVPVNSPFGVALDDQGQLLVANIGDPTLGYGPGHVPPSGGLPDSKSWAVLAVQVHDTPGRLFRPKLP